MGTLMRVQAVWGAAKSDRDPVGQERKDEHSRKDGGEGGI